ncbi:MAG: hypothetical protein ABL896_07010 [Hylemonella sp.]
MEFGPIDPEEIKVVTFPFANELGGATIATATVTSATLRGVDPAGATMVQGAAVIDGTNVKQRIKGMLTDVTYLLKAKAVDSDGLVHIQKATVLVKG